MLVGCALAEGTIESLDTPISRYLPELKGGGYEGVSIRHVMQMRSGVDYPERYDFENPGRAATNFANTEAFAAIGLQGQYIYIDPSTQTVVVKLSFFPPGDTSALDAETTAFMSAVSAWTPR